MRGESNYVGDNDQLIMIMIVSLTLRILKKWMDMDRHLFSNPLKVSTLSLSIRFHVLDSTTPLNDSSSMAPENLLLDRSLELHFLPEMFQISFLARQKYSFLPGFHSCAHILTQFPRKRRSSAVTSYRFLSPLTSGRRSPDAPVSGLSL